MSKAVVYNVKGEKVKDLELNPKVFGLTVKPDLIANAVVVQQANARYNFAHAKDRSDVSGGGRKPWRQKGTGRARHGSTRSPIWRGGGVTFGPRNTQNYSLKINKKVRKKAILMSLSDKAANNKIIFVDQLSVDEAKTKKFFEILQNLNLRTKKIKLKKETKTEDKEKKKSPKAKRILIVLPKKDEKLLRSAKNIDRTEVIKADSLNVLELVKANYLLMPVESIEVIEKNFVK